MTGTKTPFDLGKAADRLSTMIQFPTVSARLGEREVDEAFAGLIDYLQVAYPETTRAATVDASIPYHLVFDIPGSRPDLESILLIAHYDVVDVQPDAWTHPPFGGEIEDGYIWGRGALDDKNVLCAQLEAVEAILASGRRPERGIVIALGGDEELSGHSGARRIAASFGDRRFHMVLDEGAVIAVGMLSQPSLPVALIGIAEKGHVNITVEARTQPGHASMPPGTTAVGILARAIRRIERRPFRPRLTSTMREFFRALAPVTRFPLGVIYRFPAPCWPLLRLALTRAPQTRALVATTQAVTMTRGSNAPNVLPESAQAVINVRILPGESVGGVLARIRRLLRRIPVEARVTDEQDAHNPVSSSITARERYEAVASIAASLAVCVPAPFLVTASTDSKWYAGHSDAIFRFLAAVLDQGEIDRIHGVDERISIENLDRMIRFYLLIVERICLHE